MTVELQNLHYTVNFIRCPAPEMGNLRGTKHTKERSEPACPPQKRETITRSRTLPGWSLKTLSSARNQKIAGNLPLRSPGLKARTGSRKGKSDAMGCFLMIPSRVNTYPAGGGSHQLFHPGQHQPADLLLFPRHMLNHTAGTVPGSACGSTSVG